jgi:CRP-like cAMP-binding protein
MPRRVFKKSAEICHALKATPFSQLSGQDLTMLAQSAQMLSFESGELLWTKGDTGTFACIVDGAFDVVRFGITVDTVGYGQVLGHSALWGEPHASDVRARVTEKGRAPVAVVWRVDAPSINELFSSTKIQRIFLRDALLLIHHLNDLQILYRRKCSAIAHIATHLRRLAQCDADRSEVEISQKDLGQLAGYDQRTVRIALSQLQKLGCIVVARRSVYQVDGDALSALIGHETRGDCMAPAPKPAR